MAACDRATDEQEEKFAIKKAQILSSTSHWDLRSRKYLEAVLDQLGMMTAWYLYGNGEISIDDTSEWIALEPTVIIPAINAVIKPELNIEVSDIYCKFPSTLWFEMDNLDENLTVELDPDVAILFPDASAVNEGLRLLMRLIQQNQSQQNNLISNK
jgi:hypothetical protein